MELREFLATHARSWRKSHVDPKGFGALKILTAVSPSDYLSFAEKDIRAGGSRGLVNALSNSKRAIDCAIHNLLTGIGLPVPYSFPDRLDRVQSLGLVAPRIVRKIGRLRNLLEHEYYQPERGETEDALDVTALFVATLRPHFAGGSYMTSGWIADESSTNPRGEFTRTATHTTWRHDSEPKYTFARGIYFDTDVGAKRIEIDLVHENVQVGSFALEPRDRGYVEFQGLLLRAELDDMTYSRKGATAFLKVLELAAP